MENTHPDEEVYNRLVNITLPVDSFEDLRYILVSYINDFEDNEDDIKPLKDLLDNIDNQVYKK